MTHICIEMCNYIIIIKLLLLLLLPVLSLLLIAQVMNYNASNVVHLTVCTHAQKLVEFHQFIS